METVPTAARRAASLLDEDVDAAAGRPVSVVRGSPVHDLIADGAERLLTEFRMHAAWILDRATQVARPMRPLRGLIALIEAFRLSHPGGGLLERGLEVRCRRTGSGRGDLRGRA